MSGGADGTGERAHGDGQEYAGGRAEAGDGTGALAGGHHAVVVVGGGQAGLAMSHHLTRRGVDHVVLERHRIGHEWRSRRWDSFCLVTPNWQCRLPGFPYAGDEPDGFMRRDEIVRYVEDYAASFGPPVLEGVTATRLSATADGFEVRTDGGAFTAGQVVVATGPYQVPVVPRIAERFPPHITQLHSGDYRNSSQLPPGEVLVVGSGQSGCQIAEDLHLDGRRVHLAVGSAPRVARFYRGRDVVAWLDLMGHYDRPVTSFDDPQAVRARANHYVTGRDGGRDIDLRAFARDGMRLYGRLAGVEDGVITFGADLRRDLDHADAVSESIKDAIDAFISAHGITAPAEPRYRPVWEPEDGPPARLDASRVTSVIWCTGFRADYRWITVPVFDGAGRPVHERGVTPVPGLYFLGLPWQHTWGSGRFSGVGADAEHLAGRIGSWSGSPAVRAPAPPRPRTPSGAGAAGGIGRAERIGVLDGAGGSAGGVEDPGRYFIHPELLGS
ncbi:FAD-dependent oxidoreductase [Sphaerisporangium melleum]|uniref:FAD-dependent oxidoreductase n=1 Tax=Sphaerisporangium melleum TaxID=321316 RepID=A0A917QXB1_9ACTN|nr:MSMEG_0569 family flavin-dependent oxidoreductase [Sphaerisporangium melleum]GGK73372.1 FAD-dependent oxidoreductase [Sphaerisporangium melleum]GII68221.1 FAD-dependent oxidoreductase [Sphaerisporangium melleum]